MVFLQFHGKGFMKQTVRTVFWMLTLSFLISGCGMRNQPDWVVYHTDEEGIYLYDQANIEKDEQRHVLKVWDGALVSDVYRKNMIAPKVQNGTLPGEIAALSVVKNLEMIDCAHKKYKISIVVLYDLNGKILLSGYDEDHPEWKHILSLLLKEKDGALLRTRYKTDASGWRSIVPDSHGDLLRKDVCKS